MPDFERPKRRILMIDQEGDLLYVFRQVYDFFENIEFYTMNHPRIGIQIATKIKPDLVISEIHFPRMENFNGEYLIRTIKELCPETRILILSVVKEETVVGRFLTVLKVDAYLKKPASLEILVNKSFDLISVPYHYP